MELLESCDVDMALVHSPEEEAQDVSFVHLSDTSFNALAPIGHPLLNSPRVTLEAIADWPLILLSQQSYTRRYFENAMNQKGLRLQVGFEMDNSELVRKYVAVGMGIGATITELFAPNHEDGSRLRVLDLSHLLPSVQICVAVNSRRDPSAAAWEFIADLKSAAMGAQPQPAIKDRAANT